MRHLVGDLIGWSSVRWKTGADGGGCPTPPCRWRCTMDRPRSLTRTRGNRGLQHGNHDPGRAPPAHPRTRTTLPHSTTRRRLVLDRSPPADGAPDLRPPRTTRRRDGESPAVHRVGSREPSVHAGHGQNPFALVIARRPPRGDAESCRRVRPSPRAPTRDPLLLVPAGHQLRGLLPLRAMRLDQVRMRILRLPLSGPTDGRR